jgi:thiol:disulfide interchange protein
MLAGGAALAHRAAAQYGGDSSTWPQNAGGYVAASEISKAEGRPMFIYFRTDWCPYCREFERRLLGSPEVEDYLRGLARVRINPEAGPRENRLAETYGVQGYPAIFWQRHASAEPIRVSRTSRAADGEARLKSPLEFVAGLRRAAGQ